jgi:S-methyl-5-thioribose-1-phosphate isomerase
MVHCAPVRIPEIEVAGPAVEVADRHPRSIEWIDGAIVIVDQCALPHAHRRLRLATVEDVVAAIARLAVRGAPAIGVAGALGVALSAREHALFAGGEDAVRRDADRLVGARPTAVNLEWGVRRALAALAGGPDAVLAQARAMLDEDERVNVAASRRAADLLLELCGHAALRIATHCNTGRLATVAEGTALGAIKSLARGEHVASVLVGETRPLLQGARLTTWELGEAGIVHRLCVDSALPAAIACGMVDCVVVGADRVAANGDVANKIGTYSLSLAAARHGIPFVVVAPESSIDRGLAHGALIAIEERGGAEVLEVAGQPIAPPGTAVYNPAFDVTPAELVTAVVSELAVYAGEIVPGARLGRDDELGTCIARHTRHVADFPRAGGDFVDLSRVYGRPWLARRLASAIASAHRGRLDRVLAVGAGGLALGALVADAADRSLASAREPGVLPGPVCAVACDGGASLEVQAGAVPARARVLLVADVLAGGATLAAAARLVERRDATIAGVAVAVELTDHGGRARLEPHAVYAALST